MEFQSSSFRRLGLGVFWIWTKRQEHNSAWQNMLLFLSSKIHFIFYQEIWSFAVKLLQSLLLVRFPVLICVGNIINLTRLSSVFLSCYTNFFYSWLSLLVGDGFDCCKLLESVHKRGFVQLWVRSSCQGTSKLSTLSFVKIWSRNETGEKSCKTSVATIYFVMNCSVALFAFVIWSLFYTTFATKNRMLHGCLGMGRSQVGFMSWNGTLGVMHMSACAYEWAHYVAKLVCSVVFWFV